MSYIVQMFDDMNNPVWEGAVVAETLEEAKALQESLDNKFRRWTAFITPVVSTSIYESVLERCK